MPVNHNIGGPTGHTSNNSRHDIQSVAALSVLIVLQLAMLGALYTQTPPHPPLTVPPFALGPFLGASLSVAVAALVIGGVSSKAGVALTLLAAALALVSYGPQKWLDESIAQIWPAVLLGQIAAVVLVVKCLYFSGWRKAGN